jgi:Glycosyl hydrolase family 26
VSITHIQDPAGPTRRPGAAPARPLRKALFASVLGLAMACTATVGNAAAHSAALATPAAVNTGKIYFGVDGTVSQAAQGQNIARHVYGQLTASVPNARMVTMGIDGLTYADVAAAEPGSATYANIVRWADTIKARGTHTFFGFVHEPESNDQAHFGTATQYISAYRHVVDVMRAQNVPNVSYVWQLTAYGFVRKDSRNVINYYPGDTYVDYVAADAYNWGGCGGGTPWRDLSAVAKPVLAFAEAHGKLAMLAEFGSQSGPQRASWLASAHQYFVENRSELVAAFYFDRPPTTPDGASCNWSLTSTADIAAFRAISADTSNFTS